MIPVRARNLLTLLLTLLPLPATAIVNIEALRVEPEPGWKTSLEMAVSGKRGNVDSQMLDAALRVDWHRAAYTSFLILQREYGETDGVRSANSNFLHLRGIYALTPRTALEAYGQLQSDQFRRLQYRALAGAGPRFLLWQQDEKASLYLGLGAFAFREELEPDGVVNENRIDTGVRFSSYLSYFHQWNETTRILSTTYYQPRSGDPNDIRALEQAALAVSLTQGLDLKLSVDVAYDSQPPAGVEKTDVSYKTSLQYRF